MLSQKPVTAIFDIGKSNKKFLLFDENYAVIEKTQTQLEEIEDDDGDPCEDLRQLELWIKSEFHKAQENYQVKTLNFSAYGASFVHINQNGEAVTPLYNYLKKFPEELLNQFYRTVGGREKFSIQTASPPMGMLNSGLQIYWLKHQKPELFEEIETSLHLPNYLGYLFTSKKSSELTSIGCHTGLWDFEEMQYHSWVRKEELQSLLPNPQSVTKIIEDNGINIGPGIHDSSAALAPYLIGLNEPFMLISTGTWSITLNPFNKEVLTYEELEKDCLCYLDIYGNQVKASRLFLGAEYSHQKKKIINHFSVDENRSWMNPDLELLKDLIDNQRQEQKLIIEKSYNSGPYPQKQSGYWHVSNFSSAKEAYHQLMLDLVSLQVKSIELAQGSMNTEKVIVTGGFSQNDLYLSLLSTFFPDKQIYTSKLLDASALGAAMVLNERTIIASGAKQFQSEIDDSSKRISYPDIVQDRNDFNELLGLKKINEIDDLNLKNYSWV
ncbi:MAG: carbohydrate kinase [Bacteroidetes bacterium]|jgi:sugar (pentulose or hexulose) kinase|nr:carbohydrate kinase [Bacteroidota bacterium]